MVDSSMACPLDDCSFEGAVDSVKNHITAKTDDAHAGKKGEDVVHEAQSAEQDESGPEQAESEPEDSDDGSDAEEDGSDESSDMAGSERAGDGSDGLDTKWVIGAGLVGLYLWLTGSQESDGADLV